MPSLREGAASTSAAASTRRHVGPRAGDVQPLGHAERGGQRLERAALGARRRSAAARASGTARQRRSASASTSRSKPLIGTRRPTPATTNASRRQAEARARLRPRRGRRAQRRVGTPLGTTANCAGRPIPRSRCSSTSRSVSVTIRSVHRAASRSSPRRWRVRGRLRVAVEDVAVRLVDHRRHAGQPRGQPADEAGLGGVGVHDRRPRAPEEPQQLQRRAAKSRARATRARAPRSSTTRQPRRRASSTIGASDSRPQHERAGVADALERLDLRRRCSPTSRPA